MIDKKNIIIRKIIEANKDTFIIFFTYGCYYSEKALEILRKNNLPYKGYDINMIDGGLQKLLSVFNDNKILLNYNPDHRTKPIIFINGKFLGGMTELESFVYKL